jgi:hypothetical protein
MSDSVTIQVSDGASVWRTYESGLPNDPQFYQAAMRSASRSHPQYRIRAIDGDGRVVDVW